MNKITIIGNLVKAPELRATQSGVNVCGFTVAVNRPKTANNPDPGADYFNVSAWRALGENCARYLEKGKKVCVVGRVSVRAYTANNGNPGASLEVLAEDVEFISPRTASADPAPVDQASGYQVVDIDDIPY